MGRIYDSIASQGQCIKDYDHEHLGKLLWLHHHEPDKPLKGTPSTESLHRERLALGPNLCHDHEESGWQGLAHELGRLLSAP